MYIGGYFTCTARIIESHKCATYKYTVFNLQPQDRGSEKLLNRRHTNVQRRQCMSTSNTQPVMAV